MTHDVDIRQANADEIDLILDWRMRVLREVFAHSGAPVGAALREANRRYYEAHLPDGSNISCFARRDGEILGCGALCVLEEMPSPDNPNGLVGYLMNIFVVPACRGKGLGGGIVDWLLARGGSLDIHRFMLETTDLGRGVYEQHGFQETRGYMIRDGAGSLPLFTENSQTQRARILAKKRLPR